MCLELNLYEIMSTDCIWYFNYFSPFFSIFQCSFKHENSHVSSKIVSRRSNTSLEITVVTLLIVLRTSTDFKMPIDLYQLTGSPPCRAVLLTAAALEVDLNLKKVDLATGEHLKPEFIKVIRNKTSYKAKHLKIQVNPLN